ncbi:UDP-N-acetylmuramate dehydrogenase [Anaerosphaera aminiphila DSM 21120]|uniref:UDP-N-acetylenolpyruvoylglucosamine reductase n=1 Tax=Anaerosphaera aminiphila DSM 21120 TaxID=1120995 RepID=A0A1M5R4L9_9FIRM|nr:UDP-N-acetylmuramate dehydrogenase [Anaerosphaera aminiphila]SHH20980.1 UDP-N-acetylmuramate dehydrogenase [Anaerosphaera aminiphila DSM 21120]
MEKFKNYGEVLYDEPLKKYTSFKTGGPANVLLIPKTESDLIESIKICREKSLKYVVLGNCTNVLVDDNGFDGIVIMLKNTLNDIKIEDNYLTAQSGATLKQIANRACEKSLTGLEFAHGIPGSVGGGVIMNAGAYDGEIKDVVESVRMLDDNLNIIELKNSEMNFGYRKSIAQENNYIILSAKFKLKEGSSDEIVSKMEELSKRRAEKQPLELPSAGSTFRRPEGYYAGKLIDDSGLRGFTHGGAGISEKHCGFVVNKNNATSKEIKETIEIVQKVVYDNFKVKLVREVKYI